MRYLILFVAISALSGCAISPDSALMLRSTTDRVHRICHDQNPKETFELLVKEMGACYLKKDLSVPIMAGPVFTSVSVQSRLDATYRENGTSEISLSMQGGLAPRVFGEHIEITKTESCSSLVEVSILNAFWEKRAEHAKAWLKGSSVDCTYM